MFVINLKGKLVPVITRWGYKRGIPDLIKEICCKKNRNVFDNSEYFLNTNLDKLRIS